MQAPKAYQFTGILWILVAISLYLFGEEPTAASIPLLMIGFGWIVLPFAWPTISTPKWIYSIWMVAGIGLIGSLSEMLEALSLDRTVTAILWTLLSVSCLLPILFSIKAWMQMKPTTKGKSIKSKS